MQKADNDQLTFEFVACRCSDVTKYEDLCPMCLQECLEFMDSTNSEDLAEYEDYIQ